ncbi:MAG: DUF2177 family protein [Sulfitobacter sp.]
MSFLIAFLVTFIAFLIADFFGLSYLLKPLFQRYIGSLMLEEFRVLPAFLFYAFLVFVVMWFVSWPALEADKSLLWVFGNAALIGAAAYGTFEFTNYAILRDWSFQMVAVDMVWGTTVTGATAVIGVWATRMFGLA